MRYAMAPTAIFFALMVTPAVHAARSEVIVAAGFVSPNRSDFRTATELLGYGRRGTRSDPEFEIGYLRAANDWLTLGPIARLYAGRMGPPYADVPPIQTWGGSIAARVEVDVFSWPRLFFWADPSIGLASIGAPGASKTMWFGGIRGGVGLGMGRENAVGVRLRAGLSYSPVFGKVTESAGVFDFGGFVLQLDGVFRVGS